jgi:hypothetical protein
MVESSEHDNETVPPPPPLAAGKSRHKDST